MPAITSLVRLGTGVSAVADGDSSGKGGPVTSAVGVMMAVGEGSGVLVVAGYMGMLVAEGSG
ncbi:MAG: hypothetical protein A2Y73_03995 [Chloroflexi bacterium RBG_13_56_8]|nr:MAG: hypothetical protein A2Y73_03995 [Chloroflexi bacterium RBG_13_56_8]